MTGVSEMITPVERLGNRLPSAGTRNQRQLPPVTLKPRGALHPSAPTPLAASLSVHPITSLIICSYTKLGKPCFFLNIWQCLESSCACCFPDLQEEGAGKQDGSFKWLGEVWAHFSAVLLQGGGALGWDVLLCESSRFYLVRWRALGTHSPGRNVKLDLQLCREQEPTSEEKLQTLLWAI